jgi:hypothetical protein
MQGGETAENVQLLLGTLHSDLLEAGLTSGLRVSTGCCKSLRYYYILFNIMYIFIGQEMDYRNKIHQFYNTPNTVLTKLLQNAKVGTPTMPSAVISIKLVN